MAYWLTFCLARFDLVALLRLKLSTDFLTFRASNGVTGANHQTK